MQKTGLIIVLLWIQSFVLSAQVFTAAASMDVAETNQAVTITYTYQGGNLSGSILPGVEGMLLVGGPYIFQSQQSVNGSAPVITSEMSYEVLFTRPGTYTIPPVTIKTKTGKVSCNPVTVRITQGRNNKSIIPKGYEGKELIMVMEPSKTKVLSGECIAIDMVVYSVFNNLTIIDVKYPEFDGGWVQDAKDAFQGEFTRATYKGKTYFKAVLRRIWMIPGIKGSLVFKPVKASFMTEVQDPVKGMMQLSYDKVSEPLTFDVVDMPGKDKPRSFTNAVGNYNWTFSIDKKQAKANEPIKAMVTISGTGNLPTLQPPILELPDEFEGFEPKEKNNFTVTIDGIRGEKKLEYMIMPRKEGNYVLGPFAFSYYNPEKGKYIELLSDSFSVNIKGTLADTTSKQLVNNGIFPGGGLHKVSTPFFRSVVYFIAWLLPFIAGIGLILFRKKLFFRVKDDTVKKLKLAEDQAYKNLEQAKLLLDKKQHSDALVAMSSAFYTYISDKFRLSRNEAGRAKLKEVLNDENLSALSVKILDMMDHFRYAPAAGSDLDTLYDTIKKFIGESGKKA